MVAYELEDFGQNYKSEDNHTDLDESLEMKDDPILDEELQWLIADEQ